tara:strand:+ start:836 stop:1156 length:321 start_codon:yes stop_codon:yes gene_type:complete
MQNKIFAFLIGVFAVSAILYLVVIRDLQKTKGKLLSLVSDTKAQQTMSLLHIYEKAPNEIKSILIGELKMAVYNYESNKKFLDSLDNYNHRSIEQAKDIVGEFESK